MLKGHLEHYIIILNEFKQDSSKFELVPKQKFLVKFLEFEP